MDYIRKISNGFAAVVPHSLLQASYSGTCPQRIILTYHGVSQKSTSQCVGVDQLREHLIWAKKHYEIIRLGDLVRELRNGNAGQRNRLVVTFDDGYRNFLKYAVPVLAELGIHATLFVPAAKVGGFNEWDAGKKGYPRFPLMTFDELRSLPEDLIEIGSHGLNHLPLNRVPLDILEAEIKESLSILEQRVGRPVTLFSFPYGLHCDEGRQNGRQLLEDAGYKAACTMRWGRFNSAHDVFALHRVGIAPADTMEDFENKLTGYYDWLAGKEACARWLRAARARLTA